MLLGFQSRDKWNLNNYDAIEIKSKGFYASSVTIPYVQNFKKKFQFQKFKTSTLKLRSALFSWLVWVVFKPREKFLLCQVALHYKHDGHSNPGKSFHLYVNYLPCYPCITHHWEALLTIFPLIIGSKNDLSKDNCF